MDIFGPRCRSAFFSALVFLLPLCMASFEAHARSILLSSPRVASLPASSPKSQPIGEMFGRAYPGFGGLADDIAEGVSGFPASASSTDAIAGPRAVSVSMAAVNQINGEATESLMHMYYSGQGWKSVNRLGSQGIDGLFYRVKPNGKLEVLIGESKRGTSQLGKTLTKGHQMSHKWILKSIDEQIAKYEKKLLSCAPAEKVGHEEQLQLLRKIRVYVEDRIYRSELFHADVKNGFLTVHFQRLEKTLDGEKPHMSKVKTRTINLADPQNLSKSDRAWYDSYFAKLKPELRKKMNSKSAVNVIDDLKKAYVDGAIKSAREERYFLHGRLFAESVSRQGERLASRLPVTWQPKAFSVVKASARIAGKSYVATEKVFSKGYVATEKVFSKGLVFVDLATNAYFTYGDYGRWQSGEIGVEYFGFKAGLRTAQSAATIVCYVDPNPVTKAVSGAAALVLFGVDLLSDPFYEAAQARTRELLEEVDQTARLDICRMQLAKRAVAALQE